MKTRAIFITPKDKIESTIQILEYELAEQPTYDALKYIFAEHFGNAHIERVSVLANFETYPEPPFRNPETLKEMDMFVIEDGKMLGLEVNFMASMIYWTNTALNNGFDVIGSLLTKFEIASGQLPEIVGPVLLFERKVWF